MLASFRGPSHVPAGEDVPASRLDYSVYAGSVGAVVALQILSTWPFTPPREWSATAWERISVRESLTTMAANCRFYRGEVRKWRFLWGIGGRNDRAKRRVPGDTGHQRQPVERFLWSCSPLGDSCIGRGLERRIRVLHGEITHAFIAQCTYAQSAAIPTVPSYTAFTTSTVYGVAAGILVASAAAIDSCGCTRNDRFGRYSCFLALRIAFVLTSTGDCGNVDKHPMRKYLYVRYSVY